jgi:hypothetical protein
MALAGGWLDVIGTRGFILLALHAGHNATFVTIGGMRAAARCRSADNAANNSRRPVGNSIASASAPRWKMRSRDGKILEQTRLVS